MGKGRLIIISAPSGTGKTTVINKFLSQHPKMVHSISCTTRPMRSGEVNGRDYHFIDKKTFEKWISENKLAEWANVHNNMYGTPKEMLDNWLSEGRDVLLDIDVVGAANLKKLYKKNSISIFLLPPSEEELKKRLTMRATDSKEVQALRLKNALEEIQHKDEYDYQVINDDLDRACKEIEEII